MSAIVEDVFGPKRIGRYEIIGIIGSGTFGRVYLARDSELSRHVAVKVPRAVQADAPQVHDDIVREAKMVGGLDHPNIVPVYDVSRDEHCGVFIVSKYIEGSNLEQVKRENHFNYRQVAEIVQKVASTLNYAHSRGLVHRDIKPGNILLDADGNPHVVDFGLALQNEKVGCGSRIVGTLCYMSPEQARGEGHLVDGRTDIFGLGVVLYELLTGKRPFAGESWSDVVEYITVQEPQPPRQIDARIPQELERICLKALEKRASDRYQAAEDMEADIRCFLDDAVGEPQSQLPRVVPKGLRAFDEHDSDFYLQLLPGAKDREGLPDCIRFWKQLVEELDPERTFRVGLLYGPSGCGKTSMIRAGLLPRLNSSIIPIYIDATKNVERGLSQAFVNSFPGLDESAPVSSMMSELRRNEKLRRSKKVVIVIDQFEQWLHKQRGESDGVLCEALRQCDAASIQSLLLVRDDFFLGITRFMDELEVRIVQGENMAKVDLFDMRHARRILTVFGQSFGCLPTDDAALAKEQNAFLDKAISMLSEDNKFIPVQLALFAEMLKGRQWLSATLKRLGGFEGVGVAFLEESFSAKSASPHYKRHAAAAQAVLGAFVRDDEGLIRLRVLSKNDLERLSGYAMESPEFESLITCLDKETRLVTPTVLPVASNESSTEDGAYYQLTHDYLVPSIRHWIASKQKETPRGRAELRFQALTANWKRNPDRRNLPSLRECFQIHWHIKTSFWSEAQTDMMRAASRRLLKQGAMCLVVLTASMFAADRVMRVVAKERVNALAEASAESIGSTISRVRTLRFWTEPVLFERLRMSKDGHLPIALALAPWDEHQLEYLRNYAPQANTAELNAIGHELAPFTKRVLPKLWNAYSSDEPSPSKGAQRLRTACLLARLDPRQLKAEISDKDAEMLAETLIDECAKSPGEYSNWLELLSPIARPIESALLGSFARYSDPDSTERYWILTMLLDLNEGQPERLVHLVDSVRGDYPLRARTQFKGDTAMALFRRGDERHLWTLLKQEANAEVRSYIMHRAFKQGCDVTKAFMTDTDASTRRATLWAMNESAGIGSEPPASLDRRQKQRVVQAVLEQDDVGIYSAVEWLVRHKLLPEDLSDLVTTSKKNSRSCYLTAEDHTMIFLDAGVFQIPLWPKNSAGSPTQFKARKIGKRYAISTNEVTVEQFQRFHAIEYDRDQAPDRRCPQINVTWERAAAYCNWLSEREGIPETQWCYIVRDPSEVFMAENFLERTGYRIPTEAEWEYACRGGVDSRRHFGELDDFFTDYMWSGRNSGGSARPVGMKIPNDFGLFDMFGNVQEWCHGENGAEIGAKYAEGDTSAERSEMILKGGSYRRYVNQIEIARRESLGELKELEHTGFRIARTIK